MAYGDFKDLSRRTASHKILRDKSFNIAKNSKDDGYQRGLASILNTFFDKKAAWPARSEILARRDKPAFGGAIKNENISNKE